MTRPAQRGLVLLLGALSALGLLEAGLRVLGWAQVRRSTPVATGRQGSSFTLLCLGDSFTQGSGVLPGQDYPSHLRRLLAARLPGRELQVVQAGVRGLNTSQLLAHAQRERLIQRFRPNVVLLLAGGSNAWNLQGYSDAAPGGLAGWALAHLDGIRSYKLLKLFHRELTTPRGRDAPRDEDLAAFQQRVARAPIPDPCRLLPTAADRGRRRRPVYDPRAAQAWLAQQIRRRPTEGNLYYGMAEVLDREARVPEALGWLLRGMAVDPHNGALYHKMQSLVRNRLRERGNIYRWLLQGVAAAPRASVNYLAMAGLHTKMALRSSAFKDRAAARWWLLQGLALEPRCERPARRLLALFEELDRGHDIKASWIDQDLRRMLRLFQGHGARVLLQTYPSNSKNAIGLRRAHARVAEIVAALSREAGVPYVDHQRRFEERYGAVAVERDFFSADVEHPSSLGYRTMAENLLEALLAAGLLPGDRARR